MICCPMFKMTAKKSSVAVSLMSHKRRPHFTKEHQTSLTSFFSPGDVFLVESRVTYTFVPQVYQHITSCLSLTWLQIPCSLICYTPSKALGVSHKGTFTDTSTDFKVHNEYGSAHLWYNLDWNLRVIILLSSAISSSSNDILVFSLRYKQMKEVLQLSFQLWIEMGNFQAFILISNLHLHQDFLTFKGLERLLISFSPFLFHSKSILLYLQRERGEGCRPVSWEISQVLHKEKAITVSDRLWSFKNDNWQK